MTDIAKTINAMRRAGASTGAALVGWNRALVGCSKTTVGAWMDSRPSSLMADFGAVGDGVRDDTAAWEKALSGVTGTLDVPAGTYRISRPLRLDASRLSILGHGAIIHVPADLSGPALTVIGTLSSADSNPDYYERYKNARTAVEGIRIVGGTASAQRTGVGLRVGGADTNTSCMAFRDVHVSGFQQCLHVGKNAYIIYWDNCHFCWGDVLADSSTNCGERMVMHACNFYDTPNCEHSLDPVTYPDSAGFIISGNFQDWQLIGCTMDNFPLRVSGSSFVRFNGHMENPGNDGTGYRYASVEGDNSTLVVRDTTLVMNPVATTFNYSPLYCKAESSGNHPDRGLILDGIEYTSQSYWTPEVAAPNGDGQRYLVAGEGRVRCGPIHLYQSGHWFSIAKWLNVVWNGGFEDSTPMAGWTVSGTGTPSGTVAVSTAAGDVRTGTNGALFSVDSGKTAFIQQQVHSVRPGQHIMGTFWMRNDHASNVFWWQLDFLGADYLTLVIPSIGVGIGLKAAWERGMFGRVVPEGCAAINVRFVLVGNATGTAALDDVHIDLV